MTQEFEEAVVVDSQTQEKLRSIEQTCKLLRSNLQVAQGSLILMGSNPNCGITADMIKDVISLVIYEIESKILAK